MQWQQVRVKATDHDTGEAIDKIHVQADTMEEAVEIVNACNGKSNAVSKFIVNEDDPVQPTRTYYTICDDAEETRRHVNACNWFDNIPKDNTFLVDF